MEVVPTGGLVSTEVKPSQWENIVDSSKYDLVEPEVKTS
jgi:hypothetical protein